MEGQAPPGVFREAGLWVSRGAQAADLHIPLVLKGLSGWLLAPPTQEAGAHAAQHPLCAAFPVPFTATPAETLKGEFGPAAARASQLCGVGRLGVWGGRVLASAGWGRLPLSLAGSPSFPSPSVKEGREKRVFINSSSPS